LAPLLCGVGLRSLEPAGWLNIRFATEATPLLDAGSTRERSHPRVYPYWHGIEFPDFERADRIGEFWADSESRAFPERLIDCEEDRTLRAVLVGMLRAA
jgi:hypothetical protein